MSISGQFLIVPVGIFRREMPQIKCPEDSSQAKIEVRFDDVAKLVQKGILLVPDVFT